MQHLKPRYLLAEAFQLLSLSRSKGYLRVRDGQLKVIYDGDTPYVLPEEVDRYAALSHPKIDYEQRKSRQPQDGEAQARKQLGNPSRTAA